MSMDKFSDFDPEDELPENIITLTGADGKEYRFEFLDLFDYQSKQYVVLLPIPEDDEEDDGEVVILQVAVSGESESYLPVDDKTCAAVYKIFKEKYKGLFCFTDGE